MGIERNGIINTATSKLMQQISYNDANKVYGISLINSYAVENKYVAAAAVFARLVLSTSRTSNNNEVSSENWFEAGVEAMRLAGAADSMSRPIFEELLETIEKS